MMLVESIWLDETMVCSVNTYGSMKQTFAISDKYTRLPKNIVCDVTSGLQSSARNHL